MSDDGRDNDVEIDADKRAHKNAGERVRRGDIRASYHGLRDSLPRFQGGKVKASSAEILRETADFIQSKERNISALEQDIDHLKGRNKALDDQIRALEMATTTGNFAAAAAVIEQEVKLDDSKDRPRKKGRNKF